MCLNLYVFLNGVNVHMDNYIENQAFSKLLCTSCKVHSTDHSWNCSSSEQSIPDVLIQCTQTSSIKSNILHTL